MLSLYSTFLFFLVFFPVLSLLFSLLSFSHSLLIGLVLDTPLTQYQYNVIGYRVFEFPPEFEHLTEPIVVNQMRVITNTAWISKKLLNILKTEAINTYRHPEEQMFQANTTGFIRDNISEQLRRQLVSKKLNHFARTLTEYA